MVMPKYFQEKNPLNSIFMPSIGKYMIHLPFIAICNAIQALNLILFDERIATNF